MNKCSMCSKSTILFQHPVYNAGNFCAECYMSIHGACGCCGNTFVPDNIEPGLIYRVRAKTIHVGETNYLVCLSCFSLIWTCFSDYFADGK